MAEFELQAAIRASEAVRDAKIASAKREHEQRVRGLRWVAEHIAKPEPVATEERKP